MANSLGSSIISSGKSMCLILFFFYHLPNQTSELLDLQAQAGILLAPDKWAILVVEPWKWLINSFWL